MSTLPADLFRCLTQGVYVVSAAHDGRAGAFTAAWLTQVAFEPPLVALSINTDHATWPLVRDSGACVVHVLKADQIAMARHFGTASGRDVDKLAAVTWAPGATGAPVIAGVLAVLECRVEKTVDLAARALVILRVVGGQVVDAEAAPLHYSETGDLDGSSAQQSTGFAPPPPAPARPGLHGR